MHHILRFFTSIGLAALVVGGNRCAQAQAVVVQQPVVEQFGVSTVVSVPDRGTAHLGSVSSSGMFARRNGLIPSGINVSRQQRHSGASAHVWIHDFEAMNAALLQAGRERTSLAGHLGGSPATMSPMAALASSQLLEQHQRIARNQTVPATPHRPSAVRDKALIPKWRSDHAATGSTARRFGSRTFK